MSFIENAKSTATMAIPGPGPSEAWTKALDAKPIDELAALWSSLQYLGLRDHTEEAWANILYFDRLPHSAPERALAIVLSVLRSEAAKSVKMELSGNLMPTLVHAHGAQLIDEIEAQARDNPQLRWLIGGTYWWIADEALQARLAAIADVDAWRADEEAREAASEPIDFSTLTVPDLARAWLAQKCKPKKDHDANWMELADYERDLREDDPDRLIDVILEILTLESDPRVLAFLAAGPLEDVISDRTIARIEREAAAHEAFRDLLRGVWYWNQSDDLKRRLDAITGLNYAARPKG